MTPDEELEFRAHAEVAEDMDYPYCRNCQSFVYLTEREECMRCGRRDIVWRPIPVDAPPRTDLRIFKWMIVGGGLILAGTLLFLMTR